MPSKLPQSVSHHVRAIAIGVLAASCLAATIVAMSPSAAAQNEAADATLPGFAVVELFTSEGCSSCPPADRLLAQIDAWATEHRTPVYALSFHVDYWNRLGWNDPYSSPAITGRQRDYAAASADPSIYTPQMVINGVNRFVGSDGKRAAAELNEALASSASAAVAIEATSASADAIEARYETTSVPDGVVLNVALVESAGVQDVSRGENAGRTLTHVNVVRDFHSVASGSGTVRLDRPADATAPLKVIAYLQEPNAGRVLAAASTPVP